jgi:hypothetical protein
MDKNLFLKAALSVAVLGLAACSSEPAKTTEVKTDDTAKKAAAGPPEPVLAKTAFYEMYTPAHTWAGDLQPISLKSGEVAGVKNSEGKAGLWTAVFGSPAQRMSRTYTYAVAEQSPNIFKGVKADGPEPWAGPTTSALTFQTGDFTIDSDAAYKAAATKAGDWLKDPEHAAKSVSLSLGAATRFPAPVWYILFGDSKNGFVALVNATTGNIIAK